MLPRIKLGSSPLFLLASLEQDGRIDRISYDDVVEGGLSRRIWEQNFTSAKPVIELHWSPTWSSDASGLPGFRASRARLRPCREGAGYLRQ